MRDYILSLEVEAPLHRLPFWLKNAAEVTWPVHDPPAVWKSWGVWGGGLPVVEVMPGAPVTKPYDGGSVGDGLPTLHKLRGPDAKG